MVRLIVIRFPSPSRYRIDRWSDTPPTITVSGSGSVVEGDYTTSESSAVITGFNIVGYDEEGHDLSYSLSGTGAELFAINSNNKQITAIGALDYDNGAQSYALNVVVMANGLARPRLTPSPSHRDG